MSKEERFGGVDFHCHLDLFPDHEAAIKRAEAAAVFTLTVTTTPKAWTRNHALTKSTRYVRAALGLHPQLVSQRVDELSLWEKYLPETRYVGEVGLDAGPSYYKSLDLQKEVFGRVLALCAEAGGKILSVHSVRSAPTVIDMVEQYLPRSRGSVVLHWFTGTKSDARKAAALGCYFSVNNQMTLSEKSRSLIAELPMERILTETDAPFTKMGERPAEPKDVQAVVKAIASIRGVTTDTVSRAMRANLKCLLS